MGAGFIAASLLGSLAGQPATAYQTSFNLRQAPNSQPNPTFTDGTPTNPTMVMTVGSKDATDTSINVTIDTSLGICVISTTCTGDPTAAAFSFSKPIQKFQFTVGQNLVPTGNGAWGSSVLRLSYCLTSTEIALGSLIATQA
jgi:hypothetical protein